MSTTNGSSATVEQTDAQLKAAARKAAAEQRKAAKAAKAAAEAEAAKQSTVDIAAIVESEEIDKAARVYVDVPGVPRVPTPDGTLATVQRERRADDSLGEYLLCEIRRAKTKGQPDSVQRYSLARLGHLKTALESAGITLFH